MNKLPAFDSLPARFYRHPYVEAEYGAYDGQHVRVEKDGQWGIFDRDAVWLAGPLRSADPLFTRWVTSEVIIREIQGSGSEEDD